MGGAIEETTRALIESPLLVPVNCDDPLGSHPLYSLLDSMIENQRTMYDDDDDIGDEGGGGSVLSPSVMPALLSTLQTLLEAGADPNLNEHEVERQRRLAGEEVRPTFGRDLFPSALGKFFADVCQSFDHRSLSPRISSWIYRVAAMLLRGGAKVDGRFSQPQPDGFLPIASTDDCDYAACLAATLLMPFHSFLEVIVYRVTLNSLSDWFFLSSPQTRALIGQFSQTFV